MNLKLINKKTILIVFLLIILIFIINWFFSMSKIEIKVINPTGSSEISYKIVNQSSKNSDIQEFSSRESLITKRVKKGSYSILIKQDETSYYKTLNTRPFLGKTKIEATLENENKRYFIGDNPGPCSYYGNELLYSYACGSNFDELNVHKPATIHSPTFTSKTLEETIRFYINGFINLNGSNKLLLSPLGGHIHDSSTEARLYNIDENLSLSSYSSLKDIQSSEDISIKPYQNGFITYNEALDNIKYFESPDSSPKDIPIQNPDPEKLSELELSVNENSIAASFIDEKAVEENFDSISDDLVDSAEDFKLSKGQTKVLVYRNDSVKEYSLEHSQQSAQLCGEDRLCALNGSVATIYDISGSKAKRINKIRDVLQIKAINNSLIIVQTDSVLIFDTENNVGKSSYSFGGYSSCGIQQATNEGYTLCVTDLNNNRRALFVDINKDNDDSIDKKIINMSLETNLISSISPYKNIIYIVPNLGERIYDENNNIYIYDNARKIKAAEDINKKVNEQKIDTSKFTIINTTL